MPLDPDSKRRFLLTKAITEALVGVPGPSICNLLRLAAVVDLDSVDDEVLAVRLEMAETETLENLADALGLTVASPTPSPATPTMDSIPLEKQQRELLTALVEADRNLPEGQRTKFTGVAPINGADRIEHPGLPNGQIPAYRGDWEVLAAEGLIQAAARADGAIVMFDVRPRGFAYYREARSVEGAQSAVVETDVRSFLDGDEFSRAYPDAAQRWRAAEKDLWSADSEEKLTDIGHKCREAMQQFADALLKRLGVPPRHADLAKDQSRVLEAAKTLAVGCGDAESALLNAQAAYWKTVSDLVQRQEHGGQKAAPLVWEDGRRVVFQTAVVMYEWHRVATRFRREVDGTQAP